MEYPKYIQQPFVCSKEGVTFIVKFLNEGENDSPIYRIFSYKRPKSRFIAEQGAPVDSALTIGADFLVYTDFECPICKASEIKGVGNIVKCGLCEDFLCLGNSTDNIFHCHDECNNTDSWENANQLQSIKGSPDRGGSMLLPSGGQKMLTNNTKPSTK